MAIIPRYTSRALPPGAQPGLITGAESRGEAGAGLAKAFGGAVTAGVKYKQRKDKAKVDAETAARTAAAAKLAERIEAVKLLNVKLDLRDGESALAAAEAETTKGRARAVASARTGGVPAKDMARISLADFDGATGKQAEALKTRPHLKARFDAMVESSRAPHELRMLTLENERRAGEEKTVLAAALGELALAAVDDPAMAPGVAGRGLAQIESAMDAGMVTPEEAAAMQGEFADNVHMAAMRGQIAQDPALALAKLESGELDDIFVEPEGAARGYAGRTPREIAEAEDFDPGFFKNLMPGLPLDEEIDLDDLVDRGPWRSPGKALGRDDIVTLLPGRPRNPDIDPRDILEKLPEKFSDDPGNPSDWLRLAVERYDGEYGLDREKLERLLPGLLVPPRTSPVKLLTGEARAAARVKAAGESAAARAKRRGLEIDMADHLTALDEQGQADNAVAARARAELPEIEYAAFQEGQAQARERHATRAEYAFMTEAEIEANIAQQAPGGGPRDTDERAAGHAIRRATADEILTARAKDPAGWAMRDPDIAAAFAVAQENRDDPTLAQKALALRLALQREMGMDQPRLLSEAEREEITGKLAQVTPAERPAIIAELRERYGEQYDGVVKELAGQTAPDTAVLMVNAGDPLLANALARGMAMDSIELKGARVLPLPMIDGKLDGGRLEDKQLYTFMVDVRVVSVIYDRKADALVPALVESETAEPDAAAASPNLPDPSQPEDTTGEIAGKFARNVPAMFKKSAGGLLQAIAESSGPDLNLAKHPMKPGQSYDEWRQERIDVWRAEKQSGPLAQFGADLAARASADLAANAPNVDPDSLKGYAYDISSALVQMAPAVGASVATRNPNIGLTVLGAQVYGDRYGESRLQERTPEQAHMDATFYALTEALPERIPLGILMKQGTKFLPRLTQSMAAEGVQEMFTEILQIGYDEGILDEEMTWGEAWDRIKRSGIVGSFVGGGLATGKHPFVSESERPGAELGPEDTGNAPSGNAASESAESGVEAVAGLDVDVSIDERANDDDRIANYAETSLHENFRNAEKQYAEPGQVGHNSFGFFDPGSDKPIIQPINDVEQLLIMAEKNVEPLTQQLREIVSELPGVEFNNARAKKPDRLGEKLEGDRRPDTLGDYLGGRIVVDDPSILTEAMRVLASRYKNVEVDNFINEPRDTGYRAIHVQIVMDNGMTAEVQIMPSDILEVYEQEHESYEKWRNKKEFSSNDMIQKEKDEARAKKAYGDAFERWLGRADTPN